MSFIINLTALFLGIFIIWWFWITCNKKAHVAGKQVIEVILENGVFQPELIHVRLNQPLHLRFIRRDPSPCAQMVIFNDFSLSAELVVGEPNDLMLVPDQQGEFVFSCQMAMYQGRLVVE